MSSTLIVFFFLAVGVLLPPIVIFSLLLCGLASFDSNSLFFFVLSNPGFLLLLFDVFCFSHFRVLPFCFFAFVIMRLPKTISLKVGRKLAHKTKDEIMTDVLRIFASLDVKAVQVAYEVVRVTFASPEHFWAAKSFSGKHLFGLWFLSNQNIFNGTRLVDVALSEVLPRFLMVDGYLCRLWYRGQPLVCNLCAVQ